MRWEYEKEGYRLSNGEWYLPDFWLPELRTWVEVKGEMIASAFDTLLIFSKSLRRPTLMVVGAPWEAKVVAFDESGDYYETYMAGMNSRMVLLNDASLGRWKNRSEYPNKIMLVDDEGLTYFEFTGCDPDEARFITGRIYDSDVDSDWAMRKYESALAASKRARFEFGEVPR